MQKCTSEIFESLRTFNYFLQKKDGQAVASSTGARWLPPKEGHKLWRMVDSSGNVMQYSDKPPTTRNVLGKHEAEYSDEKLSSVQEKLRNAPERTANETLKQAKDTLRPMMRSLGQRFRDAQKFVHDEKDKQALAEMNEKSGPIAKNIKKLIDAKDHHKKAATALADTLEHVKGYHKVLNSMLQGVRSRSQESEVSDFISDMRDKFTHVINSAKKKEDRAKLGEELADMARKLRAQKEQHFGEADLLKSFDFVEREVLCAASFLSNVTYLETFLND
jgi:hypothetical protein